MSVLNENTIIGASGAGGDYEIEQSLRFNGVDSHLTRTPTASPTSTKVWTCSFWVKRSSSGGTQYILNAGPFNSGNDFEGFTFFPDNSFRVQLTVGNSQIADFRTNALFRDPSAWYHFVVVRNNQAYAVYVNGVAQTFSMSTFGSNPVSYINATTPHEIANRIDGYNDFDGYLTEFNSIDGQALTPDSFGETGDYGEWKPIKYAGTYGTNGFYLPFEQDYAVEGFSTVTYEGNGATQYVGGTGFSPSLTWIKSRNATRHHMWYDSVRGATKAIRSSLTNAEITGATTLTAFDTDGFSLGSDSDVNTNGDSFVAWNWDMGGTTASNTNGSITSSVRANTTYGQSIVSYTGNGNSNVSIGHGLGQIPDIVIIKPRGRDDNWVVSGQYIGAEHDYMYLNATGAAGGAANTRIPNADANNINLGTFWNNINTSGIAHIAYCFSSVTGYSKIGSYSGNGSSTGPVVTLGFSPAFVMIKRTDAAEQWRIFDNTRNPTNPVTRTLNANESNAESDNANNTLNFTSTGFQLTATNGGTNASGGTYIYMAFADTREYAYWYDQSGNNNDWTSEGGLTESDVMVDSPTNNFATWNPLDSFGTPLLSEGNLKFQLNTARCRGTIASQVDGKIYFEVYNPTLVSNTNVHHMGLGSISLDINNASNMETAAGGGAVVWTYANANGRNIYARQNGSNVAQVALPNQIAAGDIISFASDSSTGKVWMAQNNSWLKANGSFDGTNALSSSNYLFQLATGHELAPLTMPVGNYVGILNCGQDSSFAGAKTPQGNSDSNDIGDFFYPVPSGFLALCTKSLPDVDVIPSENFNTVLYTGNGSARSITTGFDTGFVWTKARNQTYDHNLFDSVRGALKKISSNSSNAESSMANSVTSFDTDGFTLGDTAQVNLNGGTFVAWNWKLGGSAVSNSNGSATSQVSANVDAGISIATFTLPTTAQTIGHGLSKAPELVIHKGRVSGSAWWTFHKDIGNTSAVRLDATSAAGASTNFWNNTDPTSTVVTIGANSGGNNSWMMYCFHSVDGYSKVGSYVGNGSATDGPFVFCGFKPAFLLIKNTNSSGGSGQHWQIADNMRDASNVVDQTLFAESSSAEGHTWSAKDFLSNGFKVRSNNYAINYSGDTYIFLAFAESPFKHSNAR